MRHILFFVIGLMIFTNTHAQFAVNQDVETLAVGAVTVDGTSRENCAAWSQCNGGVCPDNPLIVSNNQARDGSKSLRFEFNQNNFILHGDGYCALRDEIRWDVDLTHGEEAWYGFSVFPTLGEGGSVKYNSSGDSWICQIKNECGSGNRGGLQIKGDNFSFGGTNLATVKYNQWNDIVIHYKYHSTAGYRIIWVNGVQVLNENYNTQTSSCKIDFKIGMYGWQPNGKTVLYFDAIKVKKGSGSYNDVAPSSQLPIPGCGNPVPWTNNSFATQTGTFTTEFDAVPEGANMDGVVGLSNGSASTYSSLACAIQFAADGKIYARNAGAYASATALTYTAGTSYHVKMVVNVSTRKYDIYVTPSGGSQVTLGTGYSFRTEQASVTQLNNRALVTITCGLAVSNFTIDNSVIPVSGVTVSPTSATINAGATTSLTATVSPADASNKAVNWSSSNTAVAAVNSSGLVSGMSEGSATITVTTQDGAKTATCVVNVTQSEGSPVKYIIIKADDLVDGGGPNAPGQLSSGWQQFIQMVKDKNIKANLGIIGSMSNYPGGDAYWNTLNTLISSGRFELWNHGWGLDPYPSYNDFIANQNLIKNKTGATMIAVGMPENKFNDGSYASLNSMNDITYIMFGDPARTSKTVLARDINIEFPTFIPDYERFVSNYPGALQKAADNGRDYFCLQVHPNNHTPEGGTRQTNLHQIIDFLKAEGKIFVTLSEYKAIHSGPADIISPSVPTGLISSDLTHDSFTLSWVAATDNVGVTGYDVFQNGTLKTSVTSTSAAITGLSSGTTYAFTVKAKDAAGNVSAASTVLNVTTGTADTQAPTIPAALVVTGVTTTTVSLSWTASTDNVAVTGYDVYQGTTLKTTVTTTSTTVTGLTAGTSYTFTVKAKDVAGNVSAASNSAATKTASTCTGGPIAFTNTAFASTSGTFTAEFDAVPGAAAMDGTFSLNSGAMADYTTMSVIIRFNTSNKIEARNGSAYAAATSVAYTPNTAYHFRLVINTTTDKYDIYVRANGGAEQTIGSQYAFRNAVTSLANRCIKTESGCIAITNFMINGVLKSASVNTSSMPLPSNVKLSVYPNPLAKNGELTIDFGANLEKANVEIFDINGKMLYSRSIENASEMNLMTKDILNKGVYIVKVSDSQSTYNQKLIIK